MTDSLKVMLYILGLSLAMSLCWNIGYPQLEAVPIDESLVAVPLDDKVNIVATDTGIIRNAVTTPDMRLWGTEYATGEAGELWLQMLNSSSQPITNSTCFVSVWYPNNTKFLNNSPMYYLEQGIYYRGFTVPQKTGVYKQSAYCTVPSLTANYSSYYNITAFDNFETGDGKGGTGLWVGDWGFSDNTYCDVVTVEHPIGSYHARCRPMESAYMERAFNLPVGVYKCNLSFWAKFYSIEAGEYFYVQQRSETGWVTLKSWTDGQDEDDTYRRYTFELNSTLLQITNGYGMIRFTGLGGDTSDQINIDNVTILSPQLLGYYQVNGTAYQYIFGSGEIHVSAPLSNLNTNVSYSIDRVLSYIVAFSPQNLLSNHNICLNNNTLLHMLTYQNCIGSDCFTYQKNETETCTFGCYEDANFKAQCIPSPFERYLWLIGLFLFALVVLGAVLYKSQ